jgi:N-acetylglucosaminyl-diphospho-decaprenol L-rhamnosyltransferase
VNAATHEHESAPLDVVVVAYRSGAVLGRCLAAAVAFAPVGARILVVDNSPEDPSAAAAVREVVSARRLSQPRNVGFAAAVNAAIAESDAPVVLLLNPDVVALTGSYDAVARIFAADPSVGAVAIRLRDESGTLMHCRRQPRWADFLAGALSFERLLPRPLRPRSIVMTEWGHDKQAVVDTASGAALFLRRAAYDDVGPLDDSFFMYWEETDWLVRARQAGWTLVFTPEIDALHLDRASSDVAANDYSSLLLESSYRYVGKHFGARRRMLLRLAWTGADLGRLIVAAASRKGDRLHEVARRLPVHWRTTATSRQGAAKH